MEAQDIHSSISTQVQHETIMKFMRGETRGCEYPPKRYSRIPLEATWNALSWVWQRHRAQQQTNARSMDEDSSPE